MKWKYLFLAVLPLTCFGLGLAAAWVIDGGILRKWEPLGTPPGGAAEFIDANDTYVYLFNKSGTLYRCPTCWEEAQPLEQPLVEPDRPCPPRDVEGPAPPGEVLDRISGRVCYVDAWADFDYVILADGSVWEWTRFSSFYGSLIYPFLAICGCLVGCIPLMVVIVFRTINKANRSQQV